MPRKWKKTIATDGYLNCLFYKCHTKEENNSYNFKISEMLFSLVSRIIDPDKSIQKAPPKIYQFVQCSSKQKQIKSFKIVGVPNVCCTYFENLKQE